MFKSFKPYTELAAVFEYTYNSHIQLIRLSG